LNEPVFVCAHGAGGHKDDRGMLALDEILSGIGVRVVRFNFPYREKGSGRPDPMPVLKARIAEVASVFPSQKLIIGGRSMGGRAASMLAADGFACAGLMLFAYPLHPAGQPEKLRDAHLPQIRCPVLCLNGTRDALCRQDLMKDVLQRVSAPWTMHWIEGADHSFHVLRSSGRSDGDVDGEVKEAVGSWLAQSL
jgi:predicted alpha/beta-hydrolase family hydrolase